jgi:hypothetical protein
MYYLNGIPLRLIAPELLASGKKQRKAFMNTAKKQDSYRVSFNGS